MWTRIIIVFIILLAEAGMGYYSFFVNNSLFSRFLFFLLSAGIMCLIIIKGIAYVLPGENPEKEGNEGMREMKE